jgi:hypothetical protein
MATDGTLGYDEAAAVIADLVDACAARSGTLPSVVVMLGGTALAARAVRPLSHDVDVYLDSLDDDAIAEVAAKYAKRYGPTFKIDATPLETIWGAIAIRDIAQSPQVGTVKTRFGAVDIRALTVETLFLVKAAADRDKDRADLALLAPHTTYSRIVERAKTLFPWYGDRQGLPDFAERLSRYTCEHFRVPLARIDRDFALPSSIAAKVGEIRQGRVAQYWPVVKAMMRTNPQHISVDPKNPSLVRFDAQAAGASDDVLQVVRNNPRHIADLAVEALKIADPARHLERLQAIRRTRGGQDPTA